MGNKMAKMNLTGKRLKINQANTVMVIAMAVSSFLVVFSLFASKALLSQRAYQSKVIDKKEEARDQLKKNVDAIETLITSYKDFVNRNENVLKGNPLGTAQNDGDNAKIILDALPSKYDFPALASSFEKLILQSNMKINGMTGTDDELAQAGKDENGNPQPIEMPFEVNVEGSYENAQKLIAILEKSIRPITINSIMFSGSNSKIQLTIKAKTYYQPERALVFPTEVVK